MPHARLRRLFDQINDDTQHLLREAEYVAGRVLGEGRSRVARRGKVAGLDRRPIASTFTTR